MVGVYFGNITKGKGFIAKGFKRAGSLYWLKESGGGYGQKRPFFLLPPDAEQGRGRGAPAAADSAALGLDGGPRQRGKEVGVRKARLRYLTRAEAEQRRGSTGASGGEQRRLRRRCCKVEEGRVEAVRVRGELGRVECLLIGVEWRWRGEGAGGRAWRPLMALRRRDARAVALKRRRS